MHMKTIFNQAIDASASDSFHESHPTANPFSLYFLSLVFSSDSIHTTVYIAPFILFTSKIKLSGSPQDLEEAAFWVAQLAVSLQAGCLFHTPAPYEQWLLILNHYYSFRFFSEQELQRAGSSHWWDGYGNYWGLSSLFIRWMCTWLLLDSSCSI